MNAELTRWSEDDRLAVLDLRIDVLNERQTEGGGLTGAGLSLADDVAAAEQSWDRLLLDWAWLCVANVTQRLEGRLGEPELGK